MQVRQEKALTDREFGRRCDFAAGRGGRSARSIRADQAEGMWTTVADSCPPRSPAAINTCRLNEMGQARWRSFSVESTCHPYR